MKQSTIFTALAALFVALLAVAGPNMVAMAHKTADKTATTTTTLHIHTADGSVAHNHHHHHDNVLDAESSSSLISAHSHSHSHSYGKKKQKPTRTEKWVWGLGSVAVISLTSLSGLVLVPITRRYPRASQHLMTFLVSLSIGTLVGEAVMHLLPDAFGVHSHSDHDALHCPDHSSGNETIGNASHSHGALPNEDGGFMMALFAILGIYTFFLFEKLLQRFHHGHGHSHSLAPPAPVHSEKSGKLLEDEHQQKPIRPIGWLILFGEIIHNLADGLAIGAAYNDSVASGLQLSIAVLWHEVPHELGDYAVLVNAGFSPFRALFWNSLANVSAFIGAIISLAAVNSDFAKQGIFAFTAGSFLYVALADLVPELQHEHETIEENPCRAQLPAPASVAGESTSLDMGAIICADKPHKKQSRAESVRKNVRWVCQQSGMICGFVIMALVSKFAEGH